MHILESLPKKGSDERVAEQASVVADDDVLSHKVTVIDGMAVVQSMGKPTWVKTCAQWADHFLATLDSKANDYDEVHLVFDRYDVPNSLKQATRERRLAGNLPITYHVSDNTPLAKVTAKQFLACASTKDELTVYLAQKALNQSKEMRRYSLLHRGRMCSQTDWTLVIFAAPKRRQTPESYYTVWMQ